MLGRKDRGQEDLFVAAPLSSLIPDDHILKRVDKILDLSWLRHEVAEDYSATDGRPSIDPESALRLMLAGFFRVIRRMGRCGCIKKTWPYTGRKNPKGKPMSTSMLYHTFGVAGVQYQKTDFLTAKRSCTVAFIPIF